MLETIITTTEGTSVCKSYKDLPSNIFTRLCAANGGEIPKWVLPYAAALDAIDRARPHVHKHSH